MYTGYERLSNGIILQAVDDYRKARKDLKLNIHNHEARLILNDCERFFLSEWLGVLTALDGKDLLAKLETEIN